MLYAVLIVAYVSVLKYMAEKPKTCCRSRRRRGGDTGRRGDLAGAAGREHRMDMMSFDAMLPVIFMGLMGFSMLVYVISDGYDLGVGMLMHRRPTPRRT